MTEEKDLIDPIKKRISEKFSVIVVKEFNAPRFQTALNLLRMNGYKSTYHTIREGMGNSEHPDGHDGWVYFAITEKETIINER